MERVTDDTTKRAVAQRFAAHGPGRLLVLALVAAVATRLAVGGWSWADALVAGIGLAALGPIEWVAHGLLFHAPTDSFRARALGTGRNHRRHHDDPNDARWVLLDRRGVIVLLLAVAVLVSVWAVPAAVLVGGDRLGPYLSALAIGWAALAHYEWTHLLIHSGYRPTTAYYRTRARDHRLHHHRDETLWLGVTTAIGDRLFGTLGGSR